jgi:hypothetical protein
MLPREVLEEYGSLPKPFTVETTTTITLLYGDLNGQKVCKIASSPTATQTETSPTLI